MLPSDLYTKKTFFTASGSAMGVWLVSTVGASVFGLDPEKYKWIGLIVAIALSFVGALNTQRKLDLQMATLTFFNGLLIFVTASGIDSINQGVHVNKSTDKEAALLPFTDHAPWWPTQSLVDSVAEQKKITKILLEKNDSLAKFSAVAKDPGDCSSFDKISAVAVPVSPVVAAGSPYEANIFLAASDSKLPLEMQANGKKLTLQTDPKSGIVSGKVSFIAAAGNFGPDGTSQQSFTAEVTYKDSVYKKKVEYLVAKPIVRVASAAIPTLYFGCGNLVSVEIPTLGIYYRPTFSAKGATLQVSNTPGRITIIPRERKMTLSVMNSGVHVEDVAFDVKMIPLPRIMVSDASGQEIFPRDGIKASAASSIKVTAQAEENFRMVLPQDARFKVKKIEVQLTRGTALVAKLISDTELVDLSAWKNKMAPGDKLAVEAKLITRTNFLEEEVNVDLGTAAFVTVVLK